jgi:hypothetical protein
MTEAEISQLNELEAYFKSIEIPETVIFNRGVTWHNVPEHVTHYFSLIRQKGLGLYTTQPSFDRLIELKAFLSSK